MNKQLYARIASTIGARANCAQKMDTHAEWFGRHSDKLREIERNELPSGSGFDSGTVIDLDASTDNKLVFTTAFHHMNDHGYTRWTHHTVTVRPSFVHTLDIHISGRDYNGIKEYIAEVFDHALRQEAQS